MDAVYPQSFTLKNLKRVIERGIFAIPQLQREFVWNIRKAVDLLDSVYRNYPIGTLLVWRTTRRNEGQLRKQLHILPPFNSANSEIFFLIDGQQRLSVLWHFLRGESSVVTNSDGNTVDFGHVYFDPYAGADEPRFLHRKRLGGDLAGRLLPVVDILSPVWRHRVGALGVRAMHQIARCRQQLLSYKAMLVFCETKERAEVRETFIRINSLGMRIGAADKAFARASKFDMRAHVRELEALLKHGFNKVNRTTVLQTLALALGIEDLGERAIDGMISKIERDPEFADTFSRVWPSLRNAFCRAADYLVYELGVPNFGFLPSEPMLTILSLYFHHNGNVRPSRAAKRKLIRWFWSTAVAARYTGRGYRPNLLGDARFAQKLARNPKSATPPKAAVPLHTLYTTDYSRPGPLSNAFLCLLRLNRPRYLEDGLEIPLGEISSRSNRSDKHHIFPRALLRIHGFDADRYNCILNVCYLVARENQHVGSRAPRNYFEDVPRNGRIRNLAMRSHLIPSYENSGIWSRSYKRGYKLFLSERARLIANGFERQAGTVLFER
jgi:hypothetical protein